MTTSPDVVNEIYLNFQSISILVKLLLKSMSELGRVLPSKPLEVSVYFSPKLFYMPERES